MTKAGMISLFTCSSGSPHARLPWTAFLSRGDCGWSMGSGGEYSGGTAKQDPRARAKTRRFARLNHPPYAPA
jgi:hypothetical protein